MKYLARQRGGILECYFMYIVFDYATFICVLCMIYFSWLEIKKYTYNTLVHTLKFYNDTDNKTCVPWNFQLKHKILIDIDILLLLM